MKSFDVSSASLKAVWNRWGAGSTVSWLLEEIVSSVWNRLLGLCNCKRKSEASNQSEKTICLTNPKLWAELNNVQFYSVTCKALRKQTASCWTTVTRLCTIMWLISPAKLWTCCRVFSALSDSLFNSRWWVRCRWIDPEKRSAFWAYLIWQHSSWCDLWHSFFT